jgi:hypothetical protein
MNKNVTSAGTKVDSSTKDELLPSAPLAANPLLAVRAGEWLIRKWRDDCGGEYDLVRFKKHISIDKFSYSKYYRIKIIEAEDIMAYYPNEKDRITDYLGDYRMDYNFRLATKKQVKKLARIIIEAE